MVSLILIIGAAYGGFLAGNKWKSLGEAFAELKSFLK